MPRPWPLMMIALAASLGCGSSQTSSKVARGTVEPVRDFHRPRFTVLATPWMVRGELEGALAGWWQKWVAPTAHVAWYGGTWSATIDAHTFTGDTARYGEDQLILIGAGGTCSVSTGGGTKFLSVACEGMQGASFPLRRVAAIPPPEGSKIAFRRFVDQGNGTPAGQLAVMLEPRAPTAVAAATMLTSNLSPLAQRRYALQAAILPFELGEARLEGGTLVVDIVSHHDHVDYEEPDLSSVDPADAVYVKRWVQQQVTYQWAWRVGASEVLDIQGPIEIAPRKERCQASLGRLGPPWWHFSKACTPI